MKEIKTISFPCDIRLHYVYLTYGKYQSYFCGFPRNTRLASCPWGLATDHGVRLLTEMYAIYIDRYGLGAPRPSSLNATDVE